MHECCEVVLELHLSSERVEACLGGLRGSREYNTRAALDSCGIHPGFVRFLSFSVVLVRTTEKLSVWKQYWVSCDSRVSCSAQDEIVLKPLSNNRGRSRRDTC